MGGTDVFDKPTQLIIPALVNGGGYKEEKQYAHVVFIWMKTEIYYKAVNGTSFFII